MAYNLDPVDTFVAQVKGNSSFLQKILFSRPALVTAAVISGFLMVAAIFIK